MTKQLEPLLTGAGVGWILATDREQRLEAIARDIGAVEKELHERTTSQVDLWRELDRDADAMKPFIQSFATPMTNHIRVLIYCLVTGGELRELEFAYVHKSVARLRAVVSLGSAELKFASEDLWDAEVLRHLGLMKMGDRPVIHGYYAFRADE